MQKIILQFILISLTLLSAVSYTSAQTVPLSFIPKPEPAPIITTVSPPSGKQGQTLELTILGQNFQNEAQIFFNPSIGINIFSVKFINNTEIKINITIASDAPLDPRDITIVNPNQQTNTLKQGFVIELEASPEELSLEVSDTTPPPPIIDLIATDAHDGKINLAWTPSEVEDFNYYAIYVSETDFMDVTDLIPAEKIFDQATKTHQVTELQDGTKYYFAVTALDKNGNENKKVLTANATPTPSTIPPVTIPIPTAFAPNQIPAPTVFPEIEKPTGLSATLIPLIVLAALAVLGGLIYSIKKYQSKKSLEKKKIKIKKEENFRFLNQNSKITKLEICTSADEMVDLIQEIIKIWNTPGETKTRLEKILGNFAGEPRAEGLPIDFMLKLCDIETNMLEKILNGPIPSLKSNKLEYTIMIAPVSGVDVEWEMAEVSFDGAGKPLNKCKIKEQGENYTYTKHVRIAKTDAEWKQYINDQNPQFADLKKIIQIHLDNLKQQEENFKKIEKFCYSTTEFKSETL